MTQQQIHAKSLEVADRYKKSVFELIEILQTLDAHKTFREYECSSLYDYSIKRLGLSEDVAYNYIAVARKAIEVPALKKEIQDNRITMSKARKIIPVLTEKNKSEWLGLASTLTSKDLQQKVAEANPKKAVNERLTYVTGKRLKLELGVSGEFETKLKRVQDLVSNSKRSAASYEDALEAALDLFLEKRDPAQKARRFAAKISLAEVRAETIETASTVKAEESGKEKSAEDSNTALRPVSRRVENASFIRRKQIAAQTNHHLNLRDQGRCTHHDSHGNRCANTRWLDRHHRVPVAVGGDNSIGNLVTLCSQHHQLLHEIRHAPEPAAKTRIGN